MKSSRVAAMAAFPAVALLVAGCGDSAESDSGSPQDGSTLSVVVSFYPLEFVTKRIVGDLATVETLTSPGVDPHDTELTPQSVAGVKAADLVVYSSMLQASVDDAVQAQGADHSFDVNDAADLLETGGEEGHSENEHDDDDDDHGHDGDDHDGVDPHFWQDPARMATVTSAIATELGETDPANADTYQANADALVVELTELKGEFDAGLASCERTDMITSHSAFGYIASEYDFHQIGITGITPDAEPSAARLADVTKIVEDVNATTVYSEVILGAQIAETVANETGAQVLVLDPLEGVTDASPGDDYMEIMRANLANLREGQGCS